jgi:hypothetical protein
MMGPQAHSRCDQGPDSKVIAWLRRLILSKRIYSCLGPSLTISARWDALSKSLRVQPRDTSEPLLLFSLNTAYPPLSGSLQ